jgi:type I restriction enzyme, S subunit
MFTRQIEGVALPLPPLPEQHRIVAEADRRLSVLDALDATIDANLARCARLRQSILQRAFEGRLVPSESASSRVLSTASL